MNKKAILFDFDGTIADTVGSGVAAFNAIAEEHGFLPITPENQGTLRDKGPREVMKALGIPAYKVPIVVRGLRSGIREAIPTLRVLDGMAVALKELRQRGYFLGIITSNSKRNVKRFLRANQLDFFDYIRAGSGIFRKTYAIRVALLLNGLKKDDVAFIGDEIRDIEAARKVGIAAVAVTWGINSKEGLLRANPDFIVNTADDLIRLFSQGS